MNPDQKVRDVPRTNDNDAIYEVMDVRKHQLNHKNHKNQVLEEQEKEEIEDLLSDLGYNYNIKW